MSRLIFNQNLLTTVNKRLGISIYANPHWCMMRHANVYYRGYLSDMKTSHPLPPLTYLNYMLDTDNYRISPYKKFVLSLDITHTLFLKPWRNATVDPNKVLIEIVDLNNHIAKIDYTDKYYTKYSSGQIYINHHLYGNELSAVSIRYIMRLLADSGVFSEIVYNKDNDYYTLTLEVADGLTFRCILMKKNSNEYFVI